jgi:hypothetical protein
VAYALAHAAGLSALFLGLWATGRAVAFAARAPVGATRLPTAAHVALGMVTWSTALFALAAAGALRPGWLRTGALAAALAGLALILPRAAARARQARMPAHPVSAAIPAAALALLAVALAALFLLSLDPRVAGDADTYHLTLPRIFLETGGFVRIPFFVYSTWPLAIELLYAVALAVRDHVLAAGLHFGCGALLVAGAAGVARRAAGSAAGILAAALLLLDPSLCFEIRGAYVDLAFALFFFLAYCAWEPAGEAAGVPAVAPRRRALLALAGVFLGGAAATKVIGGLPAAVLAALELGRGLARRRGAREIAGDLACLILPALALAAPWWARSFALTGDPLHPALYAIFGGGGEEWSAELAARTAAHHRAYGMGRTPLDLLLLPLRLTALGDPEARLRFGGAIHPVWALLTPLLAWGCFVDRAARRLALPALLWIACWFPGSQTVRLLLPAQAFLAAAAAISCARAAAAIAPRRPGALAAAALLAAALAAATGLPEAILRTAELFALARRGERAVLDSAIPPHCRFVNAELPPDARILMLDTNRSFFCHRDFLADSLFQASQMNALLRTTSDAVGLAALLRERGVTHVLVAQRDWGIDWPRHVREALAADGLLRRIYRDAEHSLYAVSPAAPSPVRGGRRTPRAGASRRGASGRPRGRTRPPRRPPSSSRRRRGWCTAPAGPSCRGRARPRPRSGASRSSARRSAAWAPGGARGSRRDPGRRRGPRRRPRPRPR